MRAAISTVETSPERLLERVLASPQMTGADLARVVSTPEPYTIRRDGQARYRVVAVDLGIKASTPRHLAARGCEVLVVPATVSAEQILAAEPDGVFFSNGPGDPAAATYAVDAMRGVLDAGRPRLRHLPGQPDPRPGARPAHVQAAVRAPRREPAGHGPRHRAGLHHQPQPRLRRRAAGERRFRGSRRFRGNARSQHHLAPRARPGPASHSTPRTARRQSVTSTSTTAWWRACACSSARCSACSTTPRRLPARTTPRTTSTTSAPCWSAPMTGKGERMPRREDLKSVLVIGSGPDRHRAGLRVRLLRHPGVPRPEAARASGSAWSTPTRPRS